MTSAQATLSKALSNDALICLDTNCLLYYFQGEMPWSASLRPVFEAKDGGRVRLLTSSLTLAELLARIQTPADETRLLSIVRQYFDFIPVSEDVGIRAAGIRQASIPKKNPAEPATKKKATAPTITTPDAIQMATATETKSLLFITNDEQLTRMPPTGGALYLKDLALDWLEDEFNACITSNATVTVPQGPSKLELNFLTDSSSGTLPLQHPSPIPAFLEAALLLGSLVEGPSAVIGLAQKDGGDTTVKAIRLLPAGRPWITPSLPDWMNQFTSIGARHRWNELGPRQLVEKLRQQVIAANAVKDGGSLPSIQTIPCVLMNVSRFVAEQEAEALDTNGQMPPHRRRQELWRRYLAPFRPLLPLLKLDGARLWRGEAQNAHELDLPRFLSLLSCAEKVIGKEAGQ